MSKRGDDADSVELVPVEQFKEFVRRVVAVPKKEIDRARERSQRGRQRTSKRPPRRG